MRKFVRISALGIFHIHLQHQHQHANVSFTSPRKRRNGNFEGHISRNMDYVANRCPLASSPALEHEIGLSVGKAQAPSSKAGFMAIGSRSVSWSDPKGSQMRSATNADSRIKTRTILRPFEAQKDISHPGSATLLWTCPVHVVLWQK